MLLFLSQSVERKTKQKTKTWLIMEALYLDLDDLKQSKSAGEKEWDIW